MRGFIKPAASFLKASFKAWKMAGTYRGSLSLITNYFAIIMWNITAKVGL